MPLAPKVAIDEAQAAARLAGAIPFRTIFTPDGGAAEEFAGLRPVLPAAAD